MNAWEERILDRQEAHEGGLKEERQRVLRNLFNKGVSAEEAANIMDIDISEVQKYFNDWE